jgi:hypothetical protein
MRKARLLLVVATLALPLFWTAAVRAAEESEEDQPNDAEVELNDNMSYWDEGMAPAPDTGTNLESSVITGTVVGSNCWLARGFVGSQYRDSALKCARNGTPLAILTDDGSLVLPILLNADGSARPDNGKVMPYAEQHVRIYGMTVRRGHERGIIVDSIVRVPPPKEPRKFATRETKSVQVTGEVVDLANWLKGGRSLTSDPKRVGEYAAAGDPLVIVTKNGRVYFPAAMTLPASPVGTAELSAYSAQRVRAYGTAIARGNGRAMIISKVVPYQPK